MCNRFSAGLVKLSKCKDAACVHSDTCGSVLGRGAALISAFLMQRRRLVFHAAKFWLQRSFKLFKRGACFFPAARFRWQRLISNAEVPPRLFLSAAKLSVEVPISFQNRPFSCFISVAALILVLQMQRRRLRLFFPAAKMQWQRSLDKCKGAACACFFLLPKFGGCVALQKRRTWF